MENITLINWICIMGLKEDLIYGNWDKQKMYHGLFLNQRGKQFF